MRSLHLEKMIPFLALFFVLVTGEVWAKSSRNLSLEQVRSMIENKGYHWTAGRTSVSDLSDEEFQKLLGVVVPPGYEKRLEQINSLRIQAPADLPSAFDWRDSSGVTPVKSQGSCGSCWDFCATAAFEAMIKIYDGRLVDLSEQHVLSCNLYDGNCGGGWMNSAYELFMNFGGVYESCMPYHVNDTDPCIHLSCEVVDRIQGWTDIPNDVSSIKTAVLTGPVAGAMTVYSDFMYYTGGCYENPGSDPVNHGVLIVGWDDSQCGGQGAWICKNSWGTGWGDDGFFYIKYGSCNIGYGAQLINYTPTPHTLLAYKDHQVADPSGDNDGIIDPDENISLQVTLENIRFEDATNVSTVLSTSNSGISVSDSVATFPDIPAHQEKTSDAPHFAFYVDPLALPGTRVDFLLSIQTDRGSFSDSLYLFVGEMVPIFSDDVEGGDNGWTHGFSQGQDDWEHGTVSGWSRTDPLSALSGTKAWGNNLGGPYPNSVNNFLESPVIDCSGYEKIRLQFHRWLAVERGIYDQARILVNGYEIWRNEAYRDHLDYDWKKQDFDISSYADDNSSVNIRFQTSSDGWVNMGGWTIDDFSLVGVGATSHNAPQPFSLLSPAHGDTLWELSATPCWQSAQDQDPGDVVNYTLFCSTDSTFGTRDSVLCSTDTCSTLADLPDDQKFFWKVKALDTYNLVRWSTETFNFTTYLREPPVGFSLSLPSDSARVFEDTLTLGWEEPQDPDPDDFIRYTLSYGQSAVFDPGSTVVLDDLSENSYTVDGLIDPESERIYFWKVKANDRWGLETLCERTWCFRVFPYIPADVNHDEELGIVDVVYLVNYLCNDGPEPIPVESADVNCDYEITIVDVVYMINYLFNDGPEPGCPW